MPAQGAAGSAPHVTVVLPAHNEAGILETTVGELVDGLRARQCRFELLIIENGSSDGTAELAASLAARHDEVAALSDPTPDYGRALRRGLLDARGDIVVSFDVDYYDLAFFDQAVAALRTGEPGIVVGTKRGAGAHDERPWTRRLVTNLFGLALRAGFGLRASDTHGMKALDRARVLPLAQRCELGADLFDTELVLRAERAGIVVAEIPVRVAELRPARSPVARRILRTLAGFRRLRRALRRV